MAKKEPSNDSENKRDHNAFFQKLGPQKLAWYAGLFQGESYFHTDKRRRAETPSDEYDAAPPLPQIKLEMVEQDLMQSIALDLDQNLIEVNRKTTAGKQVYKVALYEREKVEAFLKAIHPYIVGKKNRDKIEELLNECEKHHAWVIAGGPSKAAKIANKASQKAKALKKAELENRKD